ncbi:hypothetical protein QE428_002625 [Microbacterium sp. SORGH_AS 505]|uniref:hypothetical protein n=1 Tax=Microbacterium sp. SORGH_AS_0505 TaxID=3041770 RepID=UPI002781C3F1|nr:hypothetical protein [Microbacterium sp. SORGH_AS_0505]MDQ1127592.1 hypothetical protein [Microbacterium sp. SORGH_AS_0505]
MNLAQTSVLLSEIQLLDNRRIDENSIVAWQKLLDDLDLDVALEAVRLHRRESTAYLLPAHVRDNVARILNVALDPEDEHGNKLDRDDAALAALERVGRARLAITAGRPRG